VRAIVDRSFQRACEILDENQSLLEEGARLLLSRETLTAEDLAKIFLRLRPINNELPSSSSSRELTLRPLTGALQ
jgi:hypothetical protein